MTSVKVATAIATVAMATEMAVGEMAVVREAMAATTKRARKEHVAKAGVVDGAGVVDVVNAKAHPNGTASMPKENLWALTTKPPGVVQTV